MKTTNPLLSSILLIAGTCIGASMLALPVVTAHYGFFPSALILIICWGTTTLAGLVMLEAHLSCSPGSHLMSMAEATLGRIGQGLTLLSYSALLYALMAAMLSALYDMFQVFSHHVLHLHLAPVLGMGCLAVLFAAVIYAGPSITDLLNRLLMLGLMVCLVVIVFALSPHIRYTQLTHTSLSDLWRVWPLIATSFGYQIVIPSLRSYLGNDVKKLRLAIVIGSFLPLLCYLLWEWLILGTLTEHRLLAIFYTGQPATHLGEALTGLAPYTLWVIHALACLAIATTFVGVSLSLFDFLVDALPKQLRYTRCLALSIAFIPPMIIALCYPKGFIAILMYGSIFVMLLLQLLPTAMVWTLRRHRRLLHKPFNYQAPFGTAGLIWLIVTALGVIVAELTLLH